MFSRGEIAWLLVAIAMCGSGSAAAQRSNTAPIRARLMNAAPMSQTEIADLLQAAREGLAYQTLRLSLSPTGTPGPELLMDSDGRPKFVDSSSGAEIISSRQPRPTIVSVETFTHYTRQAARYCDGSLAQGELVVEYENTGSGWLIRARQTLEAEPLAPIFATLTGEVALTDAGHGTIGNRPARHLNAPWRPLNIRIEDRLPGRGISQLRTMPGEPIPAGATQHLWIDEQTMLPLRWSVTMAPPDAATPLDYGMFFVYDGSIDLRPPATGQEAPCIDLASPGFK